MRALTGAAHCDTSQDQKAILERIRALEERRERLACLDLFAPPSALQNADDRDPTDPAEMLHWEQYAVDAQLEHLFDIADPRALAQYRRHEKQSSPNPDFYV